MWCVGDGPHLTGFGNTQSCYKQVWWKRSIFIVCWQTSMDKTVGITISRGMGKSLSTGSPSGVLIYVIPCFVMCRYFDSEWATQAGLRSNGHFIIIGGTYRDALTLLWECHACWFVFGGNYLRVLNVQSGQSKLGVPIHCQIYLHCIRVRVAFCDRTNWKLRFGKQMG